MFEIPDVIGHRGAAGHAPENTLAGIRRAAAFGLAMVEVDVKLTADNRPVLFHDENVGRTTDGHGRLKDMDLEEVAHLDAGISFHREFAGEAVPTLEEAVDALENAGLKVNLEIKPCKGRERETAEVAVALARDIWPAGLAPPLITSFSALATEAARKAAPDHWPVGLLYDKLPKDWAARAADLGAVSVHLNRRYLTRKKVEAVKAAGLIVVAWTVNDPGRARELRGWGVDSLITDSPPALAGHGVIGKAADGVGNGSPDG